ncbi:MAG: hypothetical protein M1150_03215 [Patescibacteria group bacterium]|nr:hypothetical protein [Patescibacteria group bacterium]
MELPKELTTVTNTSKILAGIVFITLPFIAFFAGTYYQASITPKSTDNTSVPTSKTSTSSASPSATANWKTYTNNLYGYSVKYPKDWTYVENTISTKFYPPNIGSFEGSFENNTIDQSKVPVMGIEVLTRPFSTSPTSNQNQNGIDLITEYKEMTISGVKGHYYRTNQCAPKCTIRLDLPLNVGKKTLSVYATVDSDMAIFNQILSTFKFTDQSQTDSTADWKTYTYKSTNLSPAIGYTIKYPSTWEIKTETDTGADFGQARFSPNKWESEINVYVHRLESNGFTTTQIITNDKGYLTNTTQDTLNTPFGTATRVTGVMNEKSNPSDVGKYWQVVYIEKGNNLYCLFLKQKTNENYQSIFSSLITSLQESN